jgi:hypothetical protein
MTGNEQEKKHINSLIILGVVVLVVSLVLEVVSIAKIFSEKVVKVEQTGESGQLVGGTSVSRPIYYIYDYINGFFVSGSRIFDSNANATLPGSLRVTGSSTFAGDTRAASLVLTGSVATFTATSTVTAAQICDSNLLSITPASTTPTLTLPTTSTLFADCLTTNGDMRMVNVYNNAAATPTIFAAGTGGTLKWSTASTTVNGATGALLRVVRDSATTYKAFMILTTN